MRSQTDGWASGTDAAAAVLEEIRSDATLKRKRICQRYKRRLMNFWLNHSDHIFKQLKPTVFHHSTDYR